MKFLTIPFALPPLPTLPSAFALPGMPRLVYADTDSAFVCADVPPEWVGFPSEQTRVQAIIQAADLEFDTDREPPCKNSPTS